MAAREVSVFSMGQEAASVVQKGKPSRAPGPRNAGEVVANLDLLRHPIPAALWMDLRQARLLHPDAPVPQ
jgi:hypothetical protein